MKKLILSALVIVGFMAIPKAASAQQVNDNSTANVMPMAQVWSFMKYGKHTPELYTGTLKASIPVYHYKDPDFDIPISLNYASNGYIPNMQASSTGLGWYLSAGGCVTREVNGIRDDQDLNAYTKGFHALFSTGKIYLNNDIDLFGYVQEDPQSNLDIRYELGYNRGYVESTPDIHTFNFPGHFGRFVMGIDGEVHVYNANRANGEYSVDLSNYRSRDGVDLTGIYRQEGSEITIKTGDGYEYLFERLGMMGLYGILTDPGNHTYYYERTPRNYWMLTRIMAPNGRTVTFEYGDIEYSDNCQYSIKKYTYSENGWLTSIREHVAQLKAIKIDDFTIEFQYSHRTPEKVHHIPYGTCNSIIPRELSSLKRLSSIVVTHRQEVLKTCTLTHSYAPANDNPVLFLRNVNISGEGDYQMDYYKMNSNFPAQATSHIDHWGYFNNPENGNNRYDMAAIVPEATLDTSTNIESITSTNRDPNFEGAVRGMLKTMKYPTNGYTKYYYESHKYRKMVTRDLTNNRRNLPYLKTLSEDHIAGGVRIRKITNYKTDVDSTFKEYLYNTYSTNGLGGTSSGNLLQFPKYVRYISQEDRFITRPGNISTYTMDKTHIEYSSVYERFSDGSYNWYTYTDYNSTPDIIYDYQNTQYRGNWTSIMTASVEDNMEAEMHSLAGQRGKLRQSRSYSADGDLVKSAINYYNNERTKNLKYVPTVKRAWRSNYIHRIIADDYEVATSVEDIIVDGVANGSAIVTEYEHNSKGQVVEVQHSRNFNNFFDRADHIVYVADIPANERTGPENVIVNLNMIDLPKYKYTMSRSSGELHVVEAQRYTYSLINWVPRLTKIENAILSQPQTGIANLEYEPFPIELGYIDMGRINFQTKDSSSTFYIWGYHGLYPIAEIKGRSDLITSISNVSGLSNFMNSPLTDCLSEAQDSALRNIAGASVTTYKHTPFVGITEIIDPSGLKTTFEYNDTSKLAKIIDNEGNVLEEYTYSTDNQ